mmetsp:Transcript_28293/g.90123  ORF Transcript_28293/g.90123 Transcript_28293/m.90123 type:complete len:450 (-) Transcript_28293:44-1393(-)
MADMYNQEYMEGYDDEEEEDDMDMNPFEMPPDEEVFKMREEQKRKSREERERQKMLSVAEKTTFCSRMSFNTVRERHDLQGEGMALPGGRDLASQAMPVDHRRREKENMADFIAKKREIFLVQMSLDTKRAEIRKLEERALQREEALRKSEQMLEEDALRFDAFLKENDEKVQDAIKRAEVEAKLKQDKVHEIKRLNASIQAIRSELNKYEEQLDDCRKYKEFLDSLTPQEYFEEQVAFREARKRAYKEDLAARIAAAKEANTEAALAAVDERVVDMRLTEEEVAEMKEQARINASMMRVAAEDEPPELKLEDEEFPMFFERPQQLLDIFSQLEEQNLFLIQNCQETEEALEELKNKYRDTKASMDLETSSLHAQIEALEAAIKAEEQKGKVLKVKASESAQAGVSGHETTLEELSEKVAEVYVKCAFDYDPSIGTLQMLTNIEAKVCT